MIEAVLTVAAVLVCLPTLTLAVEILAATLHNRAAAPSGLDAAGTIAVIVPAHDEEAGILPTLLDVTAQLRPGDRLLVVADNCTDGTAAVARTAGSEVVERHEAERRGKGYALDWGLRHLRQDPPDAVVIIDADCRVAPGTVQALAQASLAADRPTQALTIMKVPPRSSQQRRVQEFAWVLKNHVRPLGLARLGLPCQLMGTGMAFPWRAIMAVDLASGHLVEDVKLGLDLAARGWPPLFCPAVYIESTFPTSEIGIITQRQRWEIGSTRTLLREGPGAFWQGLTTGDRHLLALALDILVPPLSLLGGAIGLIWLAAVIAALLGGSAIPLMVATGAGLLLAGCLVLGWVKFGQGIIAARDAWQLFGYLLQKVQIYARRPGQDPQWIRTDRS